MCNLIYLNYESSENNYTIITYDNALLVAQMVKNLPAVQETQVQSLGREDPLEKEIATHFSILTWRIPWTEEPAGYHLWGHKESGKTE